ncbi:uncharacterized protein LOC136088251 [Hydra vulgaris]|uniref:Uncharacterized protein LOC136088251 n=1 Tax=Hydra vulgaris TaxID=6087 RepID=A0ABM4D181_HYDVU
MISFLTHLAPIGKSHHQLLYFTVSIESIINIPQYHTKHLYTKGNYDQINEDLANIKLCPTYNLDQLWSIFFNKLKTSINNNIPKSNFNNIKRSKWIDFQIINELKFKREKFCQYILNRNEETYNEYRISRNKTKAACRKAIIEFEKKLARDIDQNPKAFYSYVKSKIKNKEAFPDTQYNNIVTTSLLLLLYTQYNNIATTDLDKVHLFNSFFADTFSNKKITATPPFKLTCKNVNPLTNNIDLSSENIETYLKSLNSSKSPGPDALHPIIFENMLSNV